MRHAAKITLTAEEKETLERWVRSGKSEQRIVQRARIVLAAADGEATTGIAVRLGERPTTVSKWRGRFARAGLAGLQDAPRPGAKRLYDERTEQRIMALLDTPPPPGYAQWNGTLLTRELRDVSDDQVWRVLRRNRVQLERTRSWCISTDPAFATKAADIVGLYLNPPENALVICVDEKPSIQALERAQGYLRLPNGAAVRGKNFEYVRHGTTTLFAALEVMTGQIVTAHKTRKRRREFLEFMNEVVAAYPDRELHVILDNLSTHKPKHDRWLARHSKVHFHFTPTHASWMNQVECWFSILSRGALKNASFNSAADLRKAIDRFVEAYNLRAKPFDWKKAEVHPTSPKRYIANLRK